MTDQNTSQGVAKLDSSVSIETWLKDKEPWFRAVAAIAIEKREPTNQELSEIAELCESGVGSSDVAPVTVAPESDTEALSLSLLQMGPMKGIACLAEDAPITFAASGMTIVYGENGTGKSGYARLLRRIGETQIGTALLSNLAQVPPTEQFCELGYLLGNEATQVNEKWTPDRKVGTLSGRIKVFDRDSSLETLTRKTSPSYVPPTLGILDRMVTIVESLKSHFESQIEKLPSRLPQMPSRLADTVAGKKWLAATASKAAGDLPAAPEFSSESIERMRHLSTILDERAETARRSEVLSQSRFLSALNEELLSLVASVSDSSIAEIRAAVSTLASLAEAVRLAGDEMKDASVLEGVGTGTWQVLWSAARSYSDSEAYQNHEFPNIQEGARCVLCHQELGDEARQRLGSFESFVRGRIAKQHDEGEIRLKELRSHLPGELETSRFTAQIAAAGLDSATWQPRMEALLSAVNGTIAQLRAEQPDWEKALAYSSDDFPWLVELASKSTQLQAESLRISSPQSPEARIRMGAELLELEATRWIFEQQKASTAENARRAAIRAKRAAIKKTSTRAVSDFSKKVAEEAITSAFIEKFKTELLELGCSRVSVRQDSSAQKGQILFDLTLSNVHPGHGRVAAKMVLSEGEAHMVSLAGFLADSSLAPTSSPLVFDDPVSSLDDDFEDAVAKRLACYAKSQQVIVFTHRLSFLGKLAEYQESARTIVLHQRGGEFGSEASIPKESEIANKDMESALKEFEKKHLKKLNEEYNNREDPDGYRLTARGVSSEFRIIIEKTYELVLLAGIVERHRKDIRTQNAAKSLPFVEVEDCEFLNELMTKYSKLSHSLSKQANARVPAPTEFQKDLESLKRWKSEFGNRKKMGMPRI